jgi:hypothetical protein
MSERRRLCRNAVAALSPLAHAFGAPITVQAFQKKQESPAKARWRAESRPSSAWADLESVKRRLTAKSPSMLPRTQNIFAASNGRPPALAALLPRLPVT